MAARLPAPEVLDDLMYKSTAVGFAFFTIATILGAFWAAEAWGGYWSWDPKETWALIVWLNYAAWLHMRLMKGLRGSVSAWWALSGLVVTTFAFLGVNMFLSGLQRLQPLRLLRRAAVARQHLHVAGVGRRAVEDLWRQVRPAHDLAQRGVLEVAEARTMVRVPRGRRDTSSAPRGGKETRERPFVSLRGMVECTTPAVRKVWATATTDRRHLPRSHHVPAP